ncbi:MAG: SufD family Fe-S cluster assembly protein [Negativicutes bacterium]
MSKNFYGALSAFAYYECMNCDMPPDEITTMCCEMTIMGRRGGQLSRLDLNHALVRRILHTLLGLRARRLNRHREDGSWNNSWGMRINPLHHKEGISVHLVGCPIADFAKRNGYGELIPYFCEADIAASAVFRCTAVEAGAAVSASKLTINLNGEKSVADVAALYFVDGERRADLNYIIRQKAPETDATMLVSGALSDKAEKIFRGTLDFVSGSPGSVGRESEEVMLLSPQVRNRSVPLMLSGEADVDGHHAVTIGKMDENKLFYLMSRGLDDEAAKKLVVEAAVAPVLARLPDEALAQEIRDEIERRLSHA